MNRQKFSEILIKHRLISIIRSQESITSQVERVLPVLHQAGLRLIEVTLNTPDALRAIEIGVKCGARDLFFGAGTVTTVEEAKTAIGAGAQFLVCPIFSPAVIDEGGKQNVPVLPGCFTPTEVFMANQAGAEFIKLFPVTSLGPNYIKDILAPLPDMKLVAVGGVGLSNIKEYLAAGAVGVGIGNSLISGNLLKTSSEDQLLARVREFVLTAL